LAKGLNEMNKNIIETSSRINNNDSDIRIISSCRPVAFMLRALLQTFIQLLSLHNYVRIEE